jgi:hypothetical protein
MHEADGCMGSWLPNIWTLRAAARLQERKRVWEGQDDQGAAPEEAALLDWAQPGHILVPLEEPREQAELGRFDQKPLNKSADSGAKIPSKGSLIFE